MQRNDLPRIGVLSADAAAIAQFLRRIQALDAETAALLPLSPAAVPDCEPYLCGAFAHFGLAAHYPQVFDSMELLAQAALQQSAAASGARRA